MSVVLPAETRLTNRNQSLRRGTRRTAASDSWNQLSDDVNRWSRNPWTAHHWLGVGYQGSGSGSGQTSQAIPPYQKAVELSQGDSDTIAASAHAYATTGRKAEAQKILHKWLRQSETSYVSPYMIATVCAGLGGKDKAFEYLENAYQERFPDLTYFLRADLRVDSLRSDPPTQ